MGDNDTNSGDSLRSLDPRKQKILELAAKPMAQTIGSICNTMPGAGFCLFLFTDDGPEMVYVSNTNREAMVRVLKSFIEKNPEQPTLPEKVC